jgi:hypothetical protein
MRRKNFSAMREHCSPENSRFTIRQSLSAIHYSLIANHRPLRFGSAGASPSQISLFKPAYN